MSVESIKNDENSSTENYKQTSELLPGYTSIEQFTKDGYKILVEAIRNSNSLPNGRDWSFYAVHEAFNTIISNESHNVLKQINCILRNNQVEGNIRNRVLEEKTELMIEANDTILEKVANNIDEMNGVRKTANEPVLIQTVSAQLPINGSWNRVNNATFSVSSSITSESSRQSINAIRLLTAKNIIRPQKFFKDKIVNSGKYPWEPRIKEKPNSLKPLAIFLEETEKGEEYSHPYEFELDRFTPCSAQLKKEIALVPSKVEDTPLVEVCQPEQIDELIEVLRNCKEFAVDLEHHSYRSFMGITCLMQISTREKDYLIDTLVLRDKLYMLNEVFTKPSIVKIFHGAEMDIQWLQRDLSLYVVNMFDTYQAAKQLGYAGLSLSYLMQKFCSFIPNKQFQLADWRIRPLPEELKAYAREDTHYLIYIYQMLKNELIDRANGHDNLLLSVIKSSTETCKKRYFRPVLREDSHLDFYRKCKRLFDNRQLYALRELYKWRDGISREQDESTGYVLPNHMLLQISEMLPREIQGILACCNPIPPLVRSNLLEIHQIILKAKEQPLEQPILKEDTRARGTTLKISKINVDSPLHCPHDLTKTGEIRDNLPTLLGKKTTTKDMGVLINTKLEIESNCSIYTVFDTPENLSDEEVSASKVQRFTFLGPFERYKLIKPFIQAEEEKLAAEKAKHEEKNKEKPVPEGGIQEDTRTDEERIESIREHFLNLARKAEPVVNEIVSDQDFIQLGGSKRKRDLSLPEEMDYPSLGSDRQASVSNTNKGNYNPRKRRSSDFVDGDSPNKTMKYNEINLSTQRQKSKKKNKNKQQNYMQNTPDKQNTPNLKKHNKNKRFNYNYEQGEHLQCTSNYQNYQDHGENQGNDDHSDGSSNVSQQRSDLHQETNTLYTNKSSAHSNSFGNIKNKKRKSFQGGRGGKQKNKQPGGSQHQTVQPEQNQDFTSFDYSSVDFKQFQGGAGGIQTSQEIKSTFKSKGKKKKRGNRGNNNRSSTFANFKGSGGRGR